MIRLRRRLAACVEGFGKPTLYLDKLPPDERKRILNARQSIRTRNVGDAIIMELSFVGQDRCASIIGVYGCIASCCILLLTGLSAKSPVRGGIDVGLGMDISERGAPEVYGPVLGNAYILESKVADYPRAVASDGLIAYLAQTANLPERTPLARLAKSLAAKCKRFLTVDVDGKPILDFLGEEMAALSTVEERQHHLALINECIAEQRSIAGSENDSKLVARYDKLAAYVATRSDLWK